MNTDLTPAEILLAAADRLDQARAEATPGPWQVGNETVIATGVEQVSDGIFYSTNWVAETDGFGRDDNEDGTSDPAADAAWIALMNPAAGRHLAGLLREEAVVAHVMETRGAEYGTSTALDLARAILDQAGDR